jgi:ABC-type multidrug transport system ATPase subunit
VIRLSGVGLAYRPGTPVLASVEAELPAGLTLVVGPNGCGKSTLLKIAAGIERPDAGTVEIDGLDPWREEAAARRGLAYVPEQPDLTPYATIAEILDLVCALRGAPASEGRAALERVGLAPLSDRTVRELSMGQRRRAVLGAAFVGRPSNVLLDEPLEAMDRAARGDILDWIDGLLAEDACIAVVSHDVEPFAGRARRSITLRAGRAVTLDPLPADPEERRALLERTLRGA